MHPAGAPISLDPMTTQPEPGSEPQPQLTDDQIEFLNSLFDFARQGNTEALLSVIDQGVPVDLTDHKGDTLLILATYNQQADLVAALLARGADVQRLNQRGQSALTCAVFTQHEGNVRALLAAGADPDAGAQSARATAAQFQLEAMSALLEH